jgi:hypothetical protein
MQRAGRRYAVVRYQKQQELAEEAFPLAHRLIEEIRTAESCKAELQQGAKRYNCALKLSKHLLAPPLKRRKTLGYA